MAGPKHLLLLLLLILSTSTLIVSGEDFKPITGHKFFGSLVMEDPMVRLTEITKEGEFPAARGLQVEMGLLNIIPTSFLRRRNSLCANQVRRLGFLQDVRGVVIPVSARDRHSHCGKGNDVYKIHIYSPYVVEAYIFGTCIRGSPNCQLAGTDLLFNDLQGKKVQWSLE